MAISNEMVGTACSYVGYNELKIIKKKNVLEMKLLNFQLSEFHKKVCSIYLKSITTRSNLLSLVWSL